MKKYIIAILLVAIASAFNASAESLGIQTVNDVISEVFTPNKKDIEVYGKDGLSVVIDMCNEMQTVPFVQHGIEVEESARRVLQKYGWLTVFSYDLKKCNRTISIITWDNSKNLAQIWMFEVIP